MNDELVASSWSPLSQFEHTSLLIRWIGNYCKGFNKRLT
ncbi:hypothetical protein PFLA_a2684 [Pseudoalteromonas flavipulchra NCIMB 2033 = ATCC BAA-314]|nr:hypothetical protein [Pseudoalteromonas flavipulchra NCIMB 2033 = ATCC BAA-314]